MNRISISGEISSWGYSARWLRQELSQLSGDIEVEISSYGGDVFEGVDMYNELRKYSKEKGKVTTVNKAKAMSIASLIFLAGDTKKAYVNATIMIHKAWTWMAGNADDLLKEAKVLDSIDNVLISEYNKYMKENKDTIKDILKDEGWYIGKEQMESTGFVDEFIEDEGEVQDLAFAKKAFANNIDDFKAKAKEENAKPNLEIAAKAIENMGGNAETVPSDNVKPANSNQGESMEYNENNFKALQVKVATRDSQLELVNAEKESLTLNVATLQTALDTKTAEVEALQADTETKLSEAKQDMVARVQEGMSYNLGSETVKNMMEAGSPKDSSSIALKEKESNGASQQTDENEDALKAKASTEDEIAIAYAKANSIGV